MLANPKAFFDIVRTRLFHGYFSSSQVQGTNALLAAWDGEDARWVAYGLATPWWETDMTMQPVKENGGHPYGSPPARYWRVDPETGQIYYGRGYVQLTWRFNYENADRLIPGHDLVRHPDAALDPSTAAQIMVRGMKEGWFCRYSLDDFFPLAKPAWADWEGARQIINGHDVAARIASAALVFRDALNAGGYSVKKAA